MKKTKLLKVATLAFATCLLTGAYTYVSENTAVAEEMLPSCEIVGENLSLEDNVYILYAVDFQNVTTTDEKGLLVWTTPQESYVYTTADSVLSASNTVTENGVVYPTFSYEELSAKQMTDVVYASAYVKRADAYYYSAVEKYSILEYAYNKLGKTEAEETDDDLKNLLNGMLSYGALAQTYFNYRTDSLANGDFTYVRVENAHFADGFDYGVFKTGATVNVYPDDGYCLSVSATDFTEKENGDITLTVPETKFIDTASFVEEKKGSEGLAYTLLSDDTYSVTGIGTCTDTDVVIPSTYNGKVVTSIGQNAFNGCSMTSVTIPDGVTTIGHSAFYTCYNLTYVIIPNSVMDIGSTVFYYSDNIIYNVKDGLKYIGNHNNPYLYLAGVSEGVTTAVVDNNCRFIGSHALENSDLTSIEITNNVIDIGSYAFWNCKKLEKIVIPNSIVHMRNNAFYQCTNLKNIYISDVAAWGNIDGLNNLMYWSFSNRGDWPSAEKKLYINNELATELIIPEGVTNIGGYMFNNFTNLTSITIPDSVTSIGNYAFQNCSSLANVIFSDVTTWYITENSVDFENKQNGIRINVTDCVSNATNFTNQYLSYFWYKK